MECSRQRSVGTSLPVPTQSKSGKRSNLWGIRKGTFRPTPAFRRYQAEKRGRGFRFLSPSFRTLIVVKNYTGDALNFGLASEQYKAAGGTGDVRVLIVGDDVAVGRTQGGIVGRRWVGS